MSEEISRLNGLRSFQEARRKARRQAIADLLSGRDNTLVPFDVVRDSFRLTNPNYIGIKQIQLDDIIGSIGRYHDFTREFLPLSDSMRERWVGIESLSDNIGWPPIEVFQVGEVYFVRDGNHRTAVSRQMGNKIIEAHVWQYATDIHIDAQADTDDILIGLGKQLFEDRTGIQDIDPEYDIVFTSPGRYSELLAQIENLRQKLTVLDRHERTFSESVRPWYELVYLPAIEVIEQSTLLQQFEGRTVADLFVWLSRHREALRQQLGYHTDIPELATLLAEQYGERPLSKITRQISNLLGADVPPPLADPTDADASNTSEAAEGMNSLPDFITDNLI